jgi:hypothetical protein
MAKKQTTKPFEYKLRSIVVNNFIYKVPKKPYTQMPAGNSNFNVDPKIRFSIDQNELALIMNVIGTIKETGEEFVNASALFIYHINNLNDFVNDEGGKTGVIFKDKKLEEHFIPTIIGICYSTMRGILIGKAADTILQTETLPVVNPRIFFKRIEPKEKK